MLWYQHYPGAVTHTWNSQQHWRLRQEDGFSLGQHSKDSHLLEILNVTVLGGFVFKEEMWCWQDHSNSGLRKTCFHLQTSPSPARTEFCLLSWRGEVSQTFSWGAPSGNRVRICLGTMCACPLNNCLSSCIRIGTGWGEWQEPRDKAAATLMGYNNRYSLWATGNKHINRKI